MTLARSIGPLALALAAACGGGNGGGGPGPTATQIAKMAGDSQVASAGAVLGTPFSVVVRDQAGSPVAGVTVNWAVGSGGGSIAPASSQTDANGVSSATRTLGSNAGTQTATATRTGLSGSPVTFTTFSQIQGATSIATNGGAGQSDTVLSTLATPMSVVVRDHNNAPVANVIVNWSVTGGGSVSQGVDTTDGAGISSVIRTLGPVSGSPQTVATVTGLVGSPVSISTTATAGTATEMALNGGNNQTGVINTALATSHSVIVRDVHGNGKPGVTVTWAVGDGGGSVSSTAPVTGTNGVAAVTRTLGPNTGTDTDTAMVIALAGSPVIFTATATTAPPTANVSVANNSFSPVGVTVQTGGTVTWTWTCSPCNAHNVSSTGGPDTFRSGNPTTTLGHTFSFTFTTPGTYTYECEVHSGIMRGTVTVQ